jgi:ribonuclease VapC
VQVAPFDAAQAEAARVALERFGNGRHPAALNFGDCCAYAASRCLRLPLLHNGEDFPRTDVTRVDW